MQWQARGDGKVTPIAALAADFTDHARAEQEARMLAQALRSVREAVSITDTRNIILYVNESFCKMHGFGEEDVKGKSIEVTGSPKNPPDVLRELTEATLQGGWEGELWSRRGDGTDFPISLTTAPVRDEAGRTVALINIATDITGRRRAEEAQRRSEESYRQIVETAEEGIMKIDQEEKIVFVNQRMADLFGYSPGEMTGLSVFDLMDDEGRAAAQANLARRRIGVKEQLDFKYRRKDGSPLWAIVAASPIHDAEHHYAGALTMVTDITGRKRAEDEVRQANETLAALVQKLEKRSEQEGILSELRMFLQACSSTKEVGPVIAHSMSRLFPDSEGALFLLSPSKTDLESAVRWGDFPEDLEENIFSPDACWGLRRGSVYVVNDIKSGLICPHMKHLPATAYACLPLMAKSDVLGLLHLRNRSAGQGMEALRMIADLRDVSSMLSELLSQSISNIRLSETLSTQSIRDPLTGLFNRRYMEETLQREIYRAARKQNQIGVIMADIDHFKRFNDQHGHTAGDLILTQLASLLKTRMRGVDIACRYGGEEFTLVFTETSLEAAVIRADQLKEEVKELRLRYAAQEIGSITLSMGVAAYPVNGATPEELLRTADAALYRAKQAGRDRVVAAVA